MSAAAAPPVPGQAAAATRPADATRGSGPRQAETAATAASIAALGAVLAVRLIVPGGWGAAGWVVLVAGLLLGLPHGGVDHLVPAFVLADRAPRQLLVLAGYATVAVLTWVAFRSVPAVALTVFVVVSALHFGAGEVAFDDERAGRPLRPDPVAVLATGGAALVLPVVVDPRTVAPIIALLVSGSSGLLPRGLAVTAVVVVLAAVTLTCAHTCAAAGCSRRRRSRCSRASA